MNSNNDKASSPPLPQQGGEQTITDDHPRFLECTQRFEDEYKDEEGVPRGSENFFLAWDYFKAGFGAAVLPQVVERPKFELTEEMRTALDAANKAGKAYAILPDGALMTINRGEQPEDTSDLDCPCCGGSGHKDDVKSDCLSYSIGFGPQVGEASGINKELETELTVFDMGLGFALCHKDFSETRNAIKKLQADFAKIRSSILAAPAGLGEAKAVVRGSHIKRSDFHGAGAYARCSYCGRYSDNPDSLDKDNLQCDCGKLHGWSGSFKPPTDESAWSGAAPVAEALPVAADLETLMIQHRIGVMPEYEGPWHARIFQEEEKSYFDADGATPTEAVLTAIAAMQGEKA